MKIRKNFIEAKIEFFPQNPIKDDFQQIAATLAYKFFSTQFVFARKGYGSFQGKDLT